MATHARGGVFVPRRAWWCALVRNAARSTSTNAARVLSDKMTSECASGSGQFLENIGARPGRGDRGDRPAVAVVDEPEKVEPIRAAPAETDVINMVSRGIADARIRKASICRWPWRIVRLLKVTGIKTGTALLTGGLALDGGRRPRSARRWSTRKSSSTPVSYADSITPARSARRCGAADRYETARVLEDVLAA